MFKILNYVSKYNKLEIILFLGILLNYSIQVVTMFYWFSYLVYVSIFIMISLNLLHSGVFIRKQVFILFFLTVLIIDYFNKIKNIREDYVNYNNR